MEARTLDLDLGGESHVLVPADIARPHRYRGRFDRPEQEQIASLVLRGAGAERELATVALPGSGELEVELTLFPDGTTMVVFTDLESRATTSAAFRLP